jgi:AraC family transcriptional activator FtrA
MSIYPGHQEVSCNVGARQVHRVGIVLCAQVSLGSLGLMMDLFRMGNQLQGSHRFEVKRISQDGASVAHEDGQLRADGDVSLLASMDLVVVPSMWTQGREAAANHPGLVEALRDLPAQVLVVTVCTGAYFLAASGRLDGLRATTHWMLAGGLQATFPALRVDARENLIEQGSLICSGGSMAGVDAGLRAVQLLAGRDTAKSLARLLVTDLQRGPQTRFMPPPGSQRHADREVRALQDFMNAHYAQPLTLDDMARRIHVSIRTLQRRFLAATGMTPMQYLQVVRIERSKDLLESGRLPVAEIADRVGYQDRVAFGRLFKKMAGMTPAAYRQKCQGADLAP